MKGYTGKILHVDLSTRSFAIGGTEGIFYRKYIGGSAMGAWYLLKETSTEESILWAETSSHSRSFP